MFKKGGINNKRFIVGCGASVCLLALAASGRAQPPDESLSAPFTAAKRKALIAQLRREGFLNPFVLKTAPLPASLSAQDLQIVKPLLFSPLSITRGGPIQSSVDIPLARTPQVLPLDTTPRAVSSSPLRIESLQLPTRLPLAMTNSDTPTASLLKLEPQKSILLPSLDFSSGDVSKPLSLTIPRASQIESVPFSLAPRAAAASPLQLDLAQSLEVSPLRLNPHNTKQVSPLGLSFSQPNELTPFQLSPHKSAIASPLRIDASKPFEARPMESAQLRPASAAPWAVSPRDVLRAKMSRLLAASFVETKDESAAASYSKEFLAEAEKTAALYEEYLAEVEKQGPQKNGDATEAIELAALYNAMGQPAKAAAVLAKADRYTTSAIVTSLSQVDAARYYVDAGETDKALELFHQAQKSSYGWSKGVALYDEAKILMNQGQYEEACKLLSTPVSGQYADQIQMIMTAFLGLAYYCTNDWEEAQRQSERAITMYWAIKDPLPNEGLEHHVMMAKRTLAKMEQWTKTPIFTDPTELHVVVDPERSAQTPFVVALTAYSLKSIHVAIESDHPEIVLYLAKLETIPKDAPTFFHHVTVHLLPGAQRNGFEATVTITSPELPNYSLRVPLRVEVRKMTPEDEKNDKYQHPAKRLFGEYDFKELLNETAQRRKK